MIYRILLKEFSLQQLIVSEKYAVFLRLKRLCLSVATVLKVSSLRQISGKYYAVDLLSKLWQRALFQMCLGILWL